MRQPNTPAPPTAAEARARIAPWILHEDDALLILDKPSGLAVHAGTRTPDDLDRWLAALVDLLTGERPVLVHRLDKDTSGVLVAAKRKAMAAKLGAALAARTVAKDYVALVHGCPAPATGTISLPLAKRQTPLGGRMVAAGAGDPNGQPAITDYTVLAVAPDRTTARLMLSPRTGRQHQLRAHLALIGHPIVGDPIYARGADGARLPTPASAWGGRLRLHARAISFIDPRSRLPVRFEAPLPEGFDFLDPIRSWPGAPEQSGMRPKPR